MKLDVAYKKERKKIVPFTKKIWVLSRKKPVKLRACCEKKGNKNGCFHEKIREIGRLGKKNKLAVFTENSQLWTEVI